MQANNVKRRSALLTRIAVVCAALTMAAAGSASAAPTETVLYAFRGGSDGQAPLAGLIFDSSGNLYGTTAGGGAASCFPVNYCGVVFKLAPGGTETVLHAFTAGSDGAIPFAGLIADSAGNLYGTTEGGGSGGVGVVFMLSPGGTETVLHSFTGSDGAGPTAGLIADSSGNHYGTAEGGGASGRGGVVFKLSPGGTDTVLYSFCSKSSCSDGAAPFAGLLADSSGNLFGTTESGGAPGCGGPGCGVVFKLSPSGTETVLYAFTGGSDGGIPLASLIADSSGNLYGTTSAGGAPGCGGQGCGVVFKLSPGGTETVLHAFTGGSDGGTPEAGLIADSKGNLYGTTAQGGAAGDGVVFKLSPGGSALHYFTGWTETVLYSFCSLPGCTDGVAPRAGLIADSKGNLYGTTFNGGNPNNPLGNCCGTVFKLAGTGFVPPFGAPVPGGSPPPSTFTTTIPPGSFKAHKGNSRSWF